MAGAPVWVGPTRYPFAAGPGREWMWLCNLVNDCPRWHYDKDDVGWAGSHGEAMTLGLAHAALPHPVEQPVTDEDEGNHLPLGHEYVGNLCGGFGGTTECEWFDLDTGRRCGKSPFEHDSRPPGSLWRLVRGAPGDGSEWDI